MSYAIGCDVLVNLVGLVDEVTLTYQNSATVLGSLIDPTGVLSPYNFSLSYVNGSNGNYQGTIPAATTATLVEQPYTIKVTAVSAGNTAVFYHTDTAEYLAA